MQNLAQRVTQITLVMVVVTNSLFSSVHGPRMCMILQGTPDLLSAMSCWAAPRQY